MRGRTSSRPHIFSVTHPSRRPPRRDVLFGRSLIRNTPPRTLFLTRGSLHSTAFCVRDDGNNKKAPSSRELAAEQMRSSLKELLLFKSTFFSYSFRLPQKRQTPPSWREALRSPLTQGSRKNAQHFCGTFARGAKFRDSLALPRHSERQVRRGSAFRTY